jgi:hypothetical protein
MQRSKRRVRRPASLPKAKASSPQVGIFFCFDGKLFIDSTPLQQAEESVGFVNHSLGHEEYWAQLQRSGQVPEDLEYQDCRRGRVVYDRTADQFFLYLDQCLLDRIRILKQIIFKMGLPVGGTKVQVRDDAHYRCPVCISDNLF